jgi:hypothetical protein
MNCIEKVGVNTERQVWIDGLRSSGFGDLVEASHFDANIAYCRLQRRHGGILTK